MNMGWFNGNGKFKLPKNFRPGAFPDRPDSRDYKYEDIVIKAPVIDWEKGYDIENELNTVLKTENQGGSSSCVGQAYGKYAESLNFFEEKKFVDLSPKSIYEQIFLPGGGAYLRDGAKAVVDGGISTETIVPSYENGTPPTEAYMISQTLTDIIRKEMMTYQSKEYRLIGAANPDMIADAIINNCGAVSGAVGDNNGWGDWIVKPPKTSNPWGHAFFLKGFGIDSTGKYFDFINSWGLGWGKGGRGRMYFDMYNMPENTFGIWTLVDKPNTVDGQSNNLLETIKLVGRPEVFLKSRTTNKIYWVGGWQTYQELLAAGMVSPFKEVNSLDGYKIDAVFGFIK
jgi:hypothetical protein